MTTREQLTGAADLVDRSADMLSHLVMDTGEDQRITDDVVSAHRGIAQALRGLADQPHAASLTDVATVLVKMRFQRLGLDPDLVTRQDVDLMLPEAHAVLDLVSLARTDIRREVLDEVAAALADEERRTVSRPLGVLGLQGARRIVEEMR